MDHDRSAHQRTIITIILQLISNLMNKYLISLLAFALCGLSAHAALVFYDDFDYPNGNGQHVDSGTAQWASPTGAGGNSFEGRITGTDINPLGRASERAFAAFGGQTNTSNDFSVIGTNETAYFSYNLDIDSFGGGSFTFGLNSSYGNNSVYRVIVSNTGVLSLGDWGGGTSGTGPTLALDTEYFIVGALEVAPSGSYSLVASAFTDVDSANAWAAGVTTSNIVSSEWDVSLSAASTPFLGDADRTVDGIQIIGAGTTYWDAIRIGTELGDVTVVPEPSTYAMLAGILTAGLVLIRRRIRK
ncbi:MAG: PEP-CTERM sorting domain-containing protein [Puniceicoccaceae bacterium]